ncbi:MAG: acyl-CoA/acyl-ACP dehydrogenase [Deltaproteobacteria bacterium]|nr:MAG: acyl-CoA/acyl-ACP dehydrogenase [Deltaproteobacteria bacterium]
MDFGLSEEQRLFQDTLVRFLAETVPVARVREIVQTESGHDRAVWTALAELGVAGVLVPEAFGGGGLGLLDAALAMQALGGAATPAPFLGSAVMAPVALREAGSPAQQKEWLPRIALGECCVGIAANEVFSRREDARVRLSRGRLRGHSLFAVDATGADVFLVAAEDDALAIVPRDAEGLSVEPLSTVDRTRQVGALVLDGVQPAETLREGAGAARAVERMLDAGRVALAADVLGACDRAIEMSVAYAKQREQFGRVIGSFQAVKHMCAEMVAELEPARSLFWYAAHAFDAVPQDGALTAAHAKAHLAEVGTAIAKTATEVHGGIGFTDAHDLHFFFKRVLLDRQLLGTPELLRSRAARLQGWEAA